MAYFYQTPARQFFHKRLSHTRSRSERTQSFRPCMSLRVQGIEIPAIKMNTSVQGSQSSTFSILKLCTGLPLVRSVPLSLSQREGQTIRQSVLPTMELKRKRKAMTRFAMTGGRRETRRRALVVLIQSFWAVAKAVHSHPLAHGEGSRNLRHWPYCRSLAAIRWQQLWLRSHALQCTC